MPEPETAARSNSFALTDAVVFCRTNPARIVFTSLAVLIPCFWHRYIEAGDLASHVYNAWLGQLIAKGQAPGLYVVPQWNNVLVDLSLLHLGNLIGLHAAEKIIVAAAVLIFFWGAFALIAVVAERPPWICAPCLAMLAYGYAFSMGFLNYYVSLGFACIGLALVWRGGAGNFLSAIPVALLGLLAHPIGFLWFLATLGYVTLWRVIPEWWRLVLPAGAAAAFLFLRFYLAGNSDYDASWLDTPFYLVNGADQLNLYGHQYAMLAKAAAAWGAVCFVIGAILNYKNLEGAGRRLRLALDLYLVALCVTSLLPENLRTALYAGWIGLIVSRLTAISAILGIAVLACLKPRKAYFAGFAVCAAVFFTLLYRDTRTLNRLEANAGQLTAALPYGTRIVPVLNAPDDWRIEFIHHAVERACIGRCFSYSNYEPSSLQFRIRVRPGSPIVSASSDEAESMPSGDYVVKPTDPPLTAIYQCDDSDWTKLCAAPLHPGDKTETPTLDSGEN